MKKYRYEVWALGYDKEDLCTDIETVLGTFSDEESAIQFAKMFTTVDFVTEHYTLNAELLEGDYLEIVVETIEEGDITNTNIDTKYSAYVFKTDKTAKYVILFCARDLVAEFDDGGEPVYGLAAPRIFDSKEEATYYLKNIVIPEEEANLQECYIDGDDPSAIEISTEEFVDGTIDLTVYDCCGHEDLSIINYKIEKIS